MLLAVWKPESQKERKKEITAYKSKFHIMLLMRSKVNSFTKILQLFSYKNLCCKPETQLKKEHFSVYLSFPLKCFTGQNLFCYDLAILSSPTQSTNYLC